MIPVVFTILAFTSLCGSLLWVCTGPEKRTWQKLRGWHIGDYMAKFAFSLRLALSRACSEEARSHVVRCLQKGPRGEEPRESSSQQLVRNWSYSPMAQEELVLTTVTGVWACSCCQDFRCRQPVRGHGQRNLLSRAKAPDLHKLPDCKYLKYSVRVDSLHRNWWAVHQLIFQMTIKFKVFVLIPIMTNY